nr:bifunctional nitrilase/nitrile hydratase NIT4A [Tanacetum cinerariifolium]
MAGKRLKYLRFVYEMGLQVGKDPARHPTSYETKESGRKARAQVTPTDTDGVVIPEVDMGDTSGLTVRATIVQTSTIFCDTHAILGLSHFLCYQSVLARVLLVEKVVRNAEAKEAQLDWEKEHIVSSAKTKKSGRKERSQVTPTETDGVVIIEVDMGDTSGLTVRATIVQTSTIFCDTHATLGLSHFLCYQSVLARVSLVEKMVRNAEAKEAQLDREKEYILSSAKTKKSGRKAWTQVTPTETDGVVIIEVDMGDTSGLMVQAIVFQTSTIFYDTHATLGLSHFLCYQSVLARVLLVVYVSCFDVIPYDF